MNTEAERAVVTEHVLSCKENPVLVALKVTKKRLNSARYAIQNSAKSKHDEKALTISFTYRDLDDYKEASHEFVEMLKGR